MTDKFVHKNDSGSLFKNDEKTDANPNWADWQGTLNVGGTEYWVSAWVKGGKGGKFFSLAVKEKQASHNEGVAQASAAAQPDIIDDDIPPF